MRLSQPVSTVACALSCMGLPTVIAQNYYFSAKQNAKRLHGASVYRWLVMYSPSEEMEPIHLVHVWSRELMTIKGNKQHKKKAVAVAKPRPAHKQNNNKRGPVNAIGRAIGTAVGGLPGTLIKGAAGFLGHILGSGGYRVNRNSIMMDPNGPPSFSTADEGSIIYHREYIGDVTGSTAFVNNAYNINPTNSTLFPWLANLAENFQEFDFLGLVMEYKTTSGTAVSSTNTALGTVIMGTQYDVDLPSFASKQEMENTEFSTSCVPFCNMLHPIECKPALTLLSKLYVPPGGVVPAGADAHLYNLGKFQIATVGMQAGVTVIGELWVTYQVRLMKPRLVNPGNSDLAVAHFTESPTSSATSGKIFGTAGAITVFNTSPTTLYTSGLDAVVITTPGKYMVISLMVGGTFTSNTTLSSGANISFVPGFQHDTISGWTSIDTGSGFNTTCSLVSVSTGGTGASNVITFVGGAGYATGVTDVWIIGIPDGANSNVVLNAVSKFLETTEYVKVIKGLNGLLTSV